MVAMSVTWDSFLIDLSQNFTIVDGIQGTFGLLKKMYFVFVFIQFNVPFKLFHSYRDGSIGRWGENRSTGEKPPDTPASRTWLVPHVTRAPSEARTHIGEMIE